MLLRPVVQLLKITDRRMTGIRRVIFFMMLASGI